MRQHKGFTLIEVGLVVGIIAILAAVAFPRLGNLGIEAERAAAQDFNQKLKSAYGLYTVSRGGTPQSFTEFVSNAPLTEGDPYTVSVFNVGKGGCKVEATQIQCQASDFPKLSEESNFTVTYRLENQQIKVNLPR